MEPIHSDQSNGQTQQLKSPIHEPSRLEAPPHSPGTRGRLWWLWLILGFAVTLIVAYFVVPRFLHSSQGAGAGDGKKGMGAIPVVVGKVRLGSLDIYLDGLGTVTALNTVGVHSRVDGQLMQVNYREGQVVTKDELLCQIDPRPFQASLDQHQGQLMKDQAQLKDAQANLVRYQQLLKQNLSITQAQVDTQQALVDQYVGTVKTDQGLIDADNLNLQYCQIKAPFAGRIGLRLVDPGNIVHATDTNALAVITQVQPITVVFTLAEDVLPQVMGKYNANVPLTVEAWDRAIGKSLATGKLLAVDNQVDPNTGTIKLRAIFDNQSFELFPDEFVNARLKIETLKKVIVAPDAAIQRGPDSTYVYVVNGDKVNIATVTIGPTEGSVTQILTGLSPNQQVVTDGVDKLQNGSSVTVRERAGRKKGAATQPATTQSADPASEAESSPTTRDAMPTSNPSDARSHRKRPKSGDAE